jgi:putative ABC transport system permease protein
MLIARPGFTVVAALALALGVGANSVVFSVVNSVLLRPLPFPESDRLVAVWGVSERANTDHFVFSYPNFADVRDQIQGFEQAAAFEGYTAVVTGRDEPERLRGVVASAGIFPLLGVNPLLGRGFSADEDRPGGPAVVVLGYDVWNRRFLADPNIVGKEILLNGNSTTVIGVMPQAFKFPVQAPSMDFLKPLSPALGGQVTQRGSISLRVAARLRKGTTIEQAQAQADSLALRLEQDYPDSNKGLGLRLTPMQEDLVRNVKAALWIMLGAVGFVLLIACANVANLLLTRAASRQREFGIRAALGASGLRVFRQLLTESLLLSVFGASLGSLLAVWGIEVLVRTGPANVPRVAESKLDAKVLGFTLIVSVVCGLIFGMAPAIHAARPNLNESLKEGGRQSGGSSGNRLRSLLVVAEIALSLVLLIGAGLLINSFLRLEQVSPGFSARGVLTTSLATLRAKYPRPEQQATFFQRAVDRLGSVPGVESAAAVHPIPFGGGEEAETFGIEGNPPVSPGEEPAAISFVISSGYFKTFGVPLLRGRDFADTDVKNSPRVVIINNGFARRFFPDRDPIGRRLLIGLDVDNPNPPPSEIVGVVGDVKDAELESDPGPEMYLPYTQSPTPAMDVLVKAAPGSEAAVAGSIREAIKQVDREEFIPDIRSMEQLLGRSTASRRFIMNLLCVFAALALVLAVTGIYGVMSYAVAQRGHEIGIRMALGARSNSVLRLVLSQGMMLAGIGIIAGLLIAFAVTRFLSSLLYEVSAADLSTFGFVTILLAVVAIAACYLPARRATRVDPIVALRYE